MEGGPLRPVERPEMVEHEDAVEGRGLGPPGDGQRRLRIVAELRKSDAQPHAA
jgi:hypothetical protein